MAVISSTILESRQDFELVSAGRVRSQKRIVYRVVTDTTQNEETVYIQAQSASPHPIPALYTYVGGSSYVTKVSVDLEVDYNYRRWLVVAESGELPEGTEPGLEQTGTVSGVPPLEREPVIWLESQVETIPMDDDANGNQIVNTADQPFEQPLSQDITYEVIAIRKFYASYDDISSLNDAMFKKHNDAVFLGRAIGECKYEGTTAGEPTYEDNVGYYLGTSRFLVKPGGHNLRLQSKGWKYWDRPKLLPDAVLVNSRDDENVLAVEPFFIDLDGTRLPKDQPVVYVDVVTTTGADFSDFLIPQSEVTP